jgi:hypothetical protein
MSSDDGYIIRKHEGKFWLTWYSASSDDLPPIKAGDCYHTLEAAVTAYNNSESQLPTEYGLRIILDEPEKPDYESFGVDPEKWAHGYIEKTKRWGFYSAREEEEFVGWMRSALAAGVRHGKKLEKIANSQLKETQ